MCKKWFVQIVILFLIMYVVSLTHLWVKLSKYQRWLVLLCYGFIQFTVKHDILHDFNRHLSANQSIMILILLHF